MKQMKKIGKMALALVLALCLMLGAAAPGAMAATWENVQQYGTYMCIGDSIAAGMGIGETEFLGRVPGAYHDLVAQATGAELEQFGWPAFRAVELRYMLEGEEHDAYPSWIRFFSSSIDRKNLDLHREDYVEAIRKADLITVNLGSNDVTSSAFGSAYVQMAYSGKQTDEEVIRNLEQYGNFGALMIRLLRTRDSLATAMAAIRKLLEELEVCYNQFTENFNACIKDLYELNPDATIVVVGAYNPFNNARIREDSNITLGFVMQPTVDKINRFLSQECDYADRYLFAPVPDTETWPFTVEGDNALAHAINDVHPTPAGHAYMADQILSVLPERQKMSFVDVKDTDWFSDEVRYVWENEIMNGISEDRFVPSGSTTRAQFATVLYRIAGSPEVTEEELADCPFTDLKHDWYRDAVAWAYQVGVVSGVTPDTFSPDKAITREQLVTMLWRFADSPEASFQAEAFTDGDSVSRFARTAVAWAVDEEIVNGMKDGSFAPKKTATRAQLATILTRFLEQ